MELPIWIFVLLGLVFAAQMLRGLAKKTAEFDYSKNSVLLTPAERSFYGVLARVVDESTIVFSKVRVADILKPEKGLGRKSWQSAFNKISSKHFDFVLCKRDDMSVICAIELNDKSHNSSKRQLRDSFLKKACSSADLPLLQVLAKRSYNKEELVNQIKSALEVKVTNA